MRFLHLNFSIYLLSDNEWNPYLKIFILGRHTIALFGAYQISELKILKEQENPA